MITIAAVVQRVQGLDADTLAVWVAQEWVRPRRQAGQPVFEEIDIARVRLILELRDELAVGEQAIPVVLSLLDQLHATRAQMRRVLEALHGAAEDARVGEVLARISRGSPPPGRTS
jgi:chaperone modulatory protein CbpM